MAEDEFLDAKSVNSLKKDPAKRKNLFVSAFEEVIFDQATQTQIENFLKRL